MVRTIAVAETQPFEYQTIWKWDTKMFASFPTILFFCIVGFRIPTVRVHNWTCPALYKMGNFFSICHQSEAARYLPPEQSLAESQLPTIAGLPLRTLDLFSGSGGLSKGLEMSGNRILFCRQRKTKCCKITYSKDPKTRQVQYSNGRKLCHCQMVLCSDALSHCQTGKYSNAIEFYILIPKVKFQLISGHCIWILG